MATLPRIPKFYNKDGTEDKVTKFSWVRRVGFALIKSVEVEIGGQIIDKQYGDWLNIWYEVAMMKDRGIQKMIGDVDKLISKTSEKGKYTLYIPLQFWFCRTSGLALPLVCLQYHEVKINVEFNDANKCYNISPTHYISTDTSLSDIQPMEYITQTANNKTSTAQAIKFDQETRCLFFDRISNDEFQSISYSSQLDTATTKSLVRDETNQKYLIKGSTSGKKIMPGINAVETSARPGSVRNLSLRNAFLLVEYIYLDEEERHRFSRDKHEYLIEQVQYDGERLLDANFRSIRLGFKHPCQELFWLLQKRSTKNRNDHFNYTDGYERDSDGRIVGKGLVGKTLISMNGHDRLGERDSGYYNHYVPYNYHTECPAEGINMYNFSIAPEAFQPSGSCNMSKIDHLTIDVTSSIDINYNDPALFRSYSTSYNVLRIASGLSGIVFVDQ